MGQLYSICFRKDPRREAAYAVNEEVPKSYSWDKTRPDPKDYMFDGLKDEVAGKLPGQINGQQFVIQNCQNSNLYLFDHSASINIDDCIECQIYIGPCKGSVFIRDCKNCKFLLACQQFRSRDCENLDIFLLCSTQPIIEESRNIRFGCLQLHYEHLRGQLEAADLRVFNNNWSKIHDFTPSHGNCSCLPETVNALDLVPIKRTEDFQPPNVTCAAEYSDIPLTLGMRPPPSNEVLFMVCFCDDQGITGLRSRCVELARNVQRTNTVRLVLGREVPMQPSDLERVISTNEYKDLLKKGPVIGLEWNGPQVMTTCKEVVEENGWCHLIFIAQNENTKSFLSKFYSYANVQLGG